MEIKRLSFHPTQILGGTERAPYAWLEMHTGDVVRLDETGPILWPDETPVTNAALVALIGPEAFLTLTTFYAKNMVTQPEDLVWHTRPRRFAP